MKILFFSDIHFHHTHRFSHITPDGMTIREQEHLSCADTIINLCKEESIDRIVFGGDAYGPVGDNISCQTQYVICKFFEKLQSTNLPIDIVVGNHDLLLDTINNREAHKLIPFKNWENINVYDMPCIITDYHFIYMPYNICDEYNKSFLENIKNKNEYVIFSHLEIQGINLGNGIFTKKGVDIDLLKEFKMTLQGHYHSGGSLAENIQICGSTQRLSFKDKGAARNNIIIYDTDTNKIERRSFECPDWLTFTDDNLNEFLKIDNNNYVKLELSSDIFLTKEIKNKLNQVKDKDVHIDLERISVNKTINTEIEREDEISVMKQFVNNSDNSDEFKEALIDEGVRLYNKVQNNY